MGNPTSAFNAAVLSQLGAPPSGQSLNVLDIMAAQESPGYLTTVNNPEATTRGGPGAYNLPGSVFASGVNSAGVKGYGTPQQGEAATAATLRQSNFAAILALLRKGAPPSAYTTGAPAAELRAWQGGSSADVNALKRAAGGKVTTGQTSGGSSAQGAGGGSAQSGGINPAGWIGDAAGGIGGFLGTLIGSGAGAVAGATAAGVVSGSAAASLGAAQGFYAAAKPYVVPIGVALVVAVLVTPELTGKRGNPVAVTLNEAGNAAESLTSNLGGGAGSAAPAPSPAPSTTTDQSPAGETPQPPAPAGDESPMTIPQVIQSQVKAGARSNQAIFREIERRRRAGTLIDDAAEAGAVAA